MKAHTDLSTGKIYGCEEGSWLWWHEKGHIEFNSNPKTSFWLLVQQYLFNAWMLGIMFSFISKWAFRVTVIVWAIYIFISLYEEKWCNNYAYKNYKEVKDVFLEKEEGRS